MFSTWEKESGVITGKDLGSRYWGLQGEVGNLGLEMAPESDVFGTGGSFGVARVAELVRKEMFLVC